MEARRQYFAKENFEARDNSNDNYSVVLGRFFDFCGNLGSVFFGDFDVVSGFYRRYKANNSENN